MVHQLSVPPPPKLGSKLIHMVIGSPGKFGLLYLLSAFLLKISVLNKQEACTCHTDVLCTAPFLLGRTPQSSTTEVKSAKLATPTEPQQ